ncbi:hypothetical protein KJ693_06650 [bacterium]|nr:hypothetical protein [bacterium]MBU1614980.1 hypothetical protein [bacterium]
MSTQQLQAIDEFRLRKIVKDAVRDLLEEEAPRLRLLFAPYISNEEQRQIEEDYKEPSTEVARTLTLKE